MDVRYSKRLWISFNEQTKTQPGRIFLAVVTVTEAGTEVGSGEPVDAVNAVDGLEGGGVDGDVRRLGSRRVSGSVSLGLGLGCLRRGRQLDGLLSVSVAGVGRERAAL